MVAVFENKKFKGFWVVVAGDNTWLSRTCAAAGMNVSQVDVYHCASPRSDEAFTFEEVDGSMAIRRVIKTTTEVDGQVIETASLSEPQVLQKFEG